MFFQIYIAVIEESYEAPRSGFLCMSSLCIFTSAERLLSCPGNEEVHKFKLTGMEN